MAQYLDFTDLFMNKEKLFDQVVAAASGLYPHSFVADVYNRTLRIEYDDSVPGSTLTDVTNAVNAHSPYPPACRKTEATYTLASSPVWQDLPFTTTEYETVSGMVDGGNDDRIIMVKTGHYIVTAGAVYTATVASVPSLRLRKNDTDVIEQVVGAVGDGSINKAALLTAIVRADADTDYLTVQGGNSTGATVDLDTLTFTVHALDT